jgi:hypothetical protein
VPTGACSARRCARKLRAAAPGRGGPPPTSARRRRRLHARALQAKSSLFSVTAVREYIGADVLSLLAVPVFIMEPLSILQKMAEVLEYAELLDAADRADDPVERCARARVGA